MTERSPEPRKQPPEPRKQPPEPSQEQVKSRARTLAEAGDREAGVPPEDPEAQARTLLEESEARVEDPAARRPGDPRVIRRRSDEGVPPRP